MRAKRRYWDEDHDGWVHSEPRLSAEDEFFRSLEQEDEDLMPEIFLAIQRLTDKQRFAIECHFGLRDGPRMTTRDIAAHMNISQPSVMKLIKKGLRNLEREIGHLGGAIKNAK